MTATLFAHIEADLPDHPRTLTVAAELGISAREALGLVVELLLRGLRRAKPDGELRDETAATLDLALRQPGAAAVLLRAGFLEGREAGLAIVGWSKRTGGSLEASREKKAAAAERKRREREGAGAGRATVTRDTSVTSHAGHADHGITGSQDHGGGGSAAPSPRPRRRPATAPPAPADDLIERATAAEAVLEVWRRHAPRGAEPDTPRARRAVEGALGRGHPREELELAAHAAAVDPYWTGRAPTERYRGRAPPRPVEGLVVAMRADQIERYAAEGRAHLDAQARRRASLEASVAASTAPEDDNPLDADEVRALLAAACHAPVTRDTGVTVQGAA